MGEAKKKGWIVIGMKDDFRAHHHQAIRLVTLL
jgi:hypothetical protein